MGGGWILEGGKGGRKMGEMVKEGKTGDKE